MKNIIEWIRLRYNRARIWVLERFTSRVQRFEVKDRDGNKHQVVVEREIEHVCDHKTIKEIAPTMWKCANPKCSTYFQISYKVMLTEQDLVGFLDKVATFLQHDLPDGSAKEPGPHAQL